MNKSGAYITEEELIESWGEMAEAKLKADKVPLSEAKNHLIKNTLGGEKLYKIWLKWKETR